MEELVDEWFNFICIFYIFKAFTGAAYFQVDKACVLALRHLFVFSLQLLRKSQFDHFCVYIVYVSCWFELV